MDREDKRRYFVVGSVILEIVTPVFRNKLQNDYQRKGIALLEDFLNHPPILHILFHLRHKNTWCCQDGNNCVCSRVLPLNYSQWDLLYSQNPGKCNRLCFCQYTAKPLQVDDLDLTLSSLILLNCCTLAANEATLIEDLRIFKNNYLSHNVKCGITEGEYNTLWPHLTNFVLQLDPSKRDDLIRIERRPLDEALCMKYVGGLLEVHKKLDEMDTKMDDYNAMMVERIDVSDTKMDDYNAMMVERMDVSDAKIDANIASLMAKMEVLINSRTCNCSKNKTSVQNVPYKLGQDIFTLQHQYKLTSVFSYKHYILVSSGVMMNDGRLVTGICLLYQNRLLIFNTDGSEGDSIRLQSCPQDVTAVNNSTVAVTLPESQCIVMYNINNKHKLKSIPVPGKCLGITTINNKLVVGCQGGRLLMIDDQTGDVVHTVNTDCKLPRRLHTNADRIFYQNILFKPKLYCYSYTDDRVTILTLPSKPDSITSLQDGSLYVLCWDGSVQHVSSDVQHYKPVKTKGLKSLGYCRVISYNGTQRKLFTCDKNGNVKIFELK